MPSTRATPAVRSSSTGVGSASSPSEVAHPVSRPGASRTTGASRGGVHEAPAAYVAQPEALSRTPDRHAEACRGEFGKPPVDPWDLRAVTYLDRVSVALDAGQRMVHSGAPARAT